MGAVVTIGGVVELEITPVLAASLVGVAVAVAWPTRAVAAYCGAFVGVTSPTLFVTYWHAVLATGVASVVYAVSQPVFHGVGGKLGTIAFGSCLAVHGLLRTPHVVRIRRRADEYPDRDTT